MAIGLQKCCFDVARTRHDHFFPPLPCLSSCLAFLSVRYTSQNSTSFKRLDMVKHGNDQDQKKAKTTHSFLSILKGHQLRCRRLKKLSSIWTTLANWSGWQIWSFKICKSYFLSARPQRRNHHIDLTGVLAES